LARILRTSSSGAWAWYPAPRVSGQTGRGSRANARDPPPWARRSADDSTARRRVRSGSALRHARARDGRCRVLHRSFSLRASAGSVTARAGTAGNGRSRARRRRRRRGCSSA
jgi:hypothetical protein